MQLCFQYKRRLLLSGSKVVLRQVRQMTKPCGLRQLNWQTISGECGLVDKHTSSKVSLSI